MSNRAGDAIARPDDNDIELAAASVDQELIQAGPLRPGAADAVSVFVDDLEAALLSKREQVVALGCGMLIDGANPEIQRGALHASDSAAVASSSPSALPAHSGSGSSSDSCPARCRRKRKL